MTHLEIIQLSADRQIGLSSVSFDGEKLLPYEQTCDWGPEYPDAHTENCIMLLYTDSKRIIDRAMIDGDTWREIEQNDPDTFYEAVFNELSIEQALEKYTRSPSI